MPTDDTRTPDPLTRYRNYGGALVPDPEGQWVHVGDIGVKEWALDPLVARPSPDTGLDVERLARAITVIRNDPETYPGGLTDLSGDSTAAYIAAEYARLTEAHQEADHE